MSSARRGVQSASNQDQIILGKSKVVAALSRGTDWCGALLLILAFSALIMPWEAYAAVAPGDLDPNFGGTPTVVTANYSVNDQGYDVAVDGTDMYLVGVDSVSGNLQWRIEKRDATTGALNLTFGSGTGAVLSNPSGGADIARVVVVDGTDLYVAGIDFTPGNDQWRIEKRDTTTGALDSTFGSGTGIVTINPSAGSDVIRAIILDSTGLYVVGYDDNSGDVQWRIEKRDKTTGVLDSTFGSGTGVVNSNPSAGLDFAYAVELDSTGLYVAGFDFSLGSAQLRIEKLNKTTGALNLAFGGGTGIITSNLSSNDQIFDLAVEGIDLYVVGIDISLGNFQWRLEKRDATTGALDGTFGSGTGVVTSNPTLASDYPYAVAVDATGVYVAGIENFGGPDSQWRVEKRDKITGALDATFGSGTGVVTSNPSVGLDYIYSAVVDPPGTYDGIGLYIIGFDSSPGNPQLRLEKLDTITGELKLRTDPGVVISNPTVGLGSEEARDIVLDGTSLYVIGTELVSGGDFQWRIEKRDAKTGALVVGFDGDGVVTVNPSAVNDSVEDVAVDATGLYVIGTELVSGGDFQWRIEKRDKTTGALDLTFGGGTGVVTSNPSVAADVPYAVAVDATGIYVAGYNANGVDLLWRIEKRDLSTGALDTTFGPGTGVMEWNPTPWNDIPYNMVLDATSIYTVGVSGGPSSYWYMEKRDKMTGGWDTNWGPSGSVEVHIQRPGHCIPLLHPPPPIKSTKIFKPRNIQTCGVNKHGFCIVH